jgi:uncharacterized repeat protein (TIGR02543 family)
VKNRFFIGGVFLAVAITIAPSFTVPVLGSEITSSEESSSAPVEDLVVLAVNEPVGFQSATNYSNNYRAVGSTFYNVNNKYVYLSNGAGNSAGSFFTKNKVFLTNSTSAGFSTFFEMTVYAASGYADGFTFIVSRDINVLGQAGGAIGYGGINNSIAVLFDNFDNGGQPPLCLSLGVNGSQGNCQYSGYYSGNFKVWIDYSRNTNGGRLEVRLHNANNFIRPANPARAWDNITFDQIGNEFYTGFTASTGGFSQYAFLKSWYFSASYSPNGIDPADAANFITDNTAPTNPVVEPYLIGDEWFFKPDTDYVSEPNLSYLYTFGNNQQYTFFNAFTARATFTTTDQTLYLYALDLAGNRSPGGGTYPYYRANYVLNYPGAENATRFYPGFNTNYPVTENVHLWQPTRPGYRFEGWALSPVQSTNLINTFTFNANANFFARWSFLPYTVSFQTNGGSTIAPIQTDINRGFTLPPDPTKPHHTFAGWYTDETLNNPLIIDQFAHTTMTLYAKWTIDTYLLTIDHGTTMANQEVTLDYGSEIMLSTIIPPTQDGFVFSGYYLDADFTQPVGDNLTLVGNQTIYAKWIDLRPVYAFHDTVNQIPMPLTTLITIQDHLIQARLAYENLSADQKDFVDPSVLQTLVQLETLMTDLLAVEAVVLMIDRLPRIIQLQDQEMLANAIQAYADLTPNQQALFPSDRSHHLEDLSSQYADLSKASEVEVLIWEIPSNYSVEDIETIEAAVTAFNLLAPNEVAMMDPESVLKLTLAQNELNRLKACRDFINLVEAIGPNVTLEDEGRILEAFAYYQSMSSEALASLDMQYYQYLLTYSKVLQDMTLAQPVNDLLSALPSQVTLNNEAVFLEALEAFEALSRDQQQYVDNALVSALIAAIAEISRLKNVDEEEPVDPVDPPVEPPIEPPVTPPQPRFYFPWIIIIVLVTWAGAYVLVQKQPKLIP